MKTYQITHSNGFTYDTIPKGHIGERHDPTPECWLTISDGAISLLPTREMIDVDIEDTIVRSRWRTRAMK